MIPVKINKISFHPPSRSYAVILKEIGKERRLPVIVGAFEAQAIALALEYVETPRPLTHDLIGSIIEDIEAKLQAVKITDLIDGVFYAQLEITGKTIGTRIIDSRPSDALAVALRLKAPVFVADTVMEEAGVLEKESEAVLQPHTVASPTLKELKTQLQKAVEDEEYEKAALLRDKINEMISL